jgi:hypothetical protein
MIGAGPAVTRLKSVHGAAAVDAMGGANPSATPRRDTGAGHLFDSSRALKLVEANVSVLGQKVAS